MMPAVLWTLKDPDEVLDFELDWTDRLVDDTIDTSVWVVPDGITKDSDSNTTTHTKAWFSGGTLGTVYEIVNRIVTEGGRTMDQTVNLPVRSK
jgi:hypothetical protein